PSAPFDVVARQHVAHGIDELILGHGELRLGLLRPVIVVVLAQPRDLGAEDEIFDLNFTFCSFVTALNHHAWTAAPVGIFHLRSEFAVTQIELGTNLLSRRVLSVAQLHHQALIVGNGNVGKYRHHDRPRLGLALDLAEMLQRRHQPRHADGETRRRHRLAAKARDQSVVAPTGSNGAETHRSAGLVFDLERQIHFEDWAGVVLKAAHHRRINTDLPKVVRSQRQIGDLSKFIQSILIDRAIWKSITGCANYSDVPRNVPAASRWRRKHVHYLIDLLLRETCAFRVVTTFIFSTGPKEGAHAVLSEPIIFVDCA